MVWTHLHSLQAFFLKAKDSNHFHNMKTVCLHSVKVRESHYGYSRCSQILCTQDQPTHEVNTTHILCSPTASLIPCAHPQLQLATDHLFLAIHFPSWLRKGTWMRELLQPGLLRKRGGEEHIGHILSKCWRERKSWVYQDSVSTQAGVAWDWTCLQTMWHLCGGRQR